MSPVVSIRVALRLEYIVKVMHDLYDCASSVSRYLNINSRRSTTV